MKTRPHIYRPFQHRKPGLFRSLAHHKPGSNRLHQTMGTAHKQRARICGGSRCTFNQNLAAVLFNQALLAIKFNTDCRCGIEHQSGAIGQLHITLLSCRGAQIRIPLPPPQWQPETQPQCQRRSNDGACRPHQHRSAVTALRTRSAQHGHAHRRRHGAELVRQRLRLCPDLAMRRALRQPLLQPFSV